MSVRTEAWTAQVMGPGSLSSLPQPPLTHSICLRNHQNVCLVFREWNEVKIKLLSLLSPDMTNFTSFVPSHSLGKAPPPFVQEQDKQAWRTLFL